MLTMLLIVCPLVLLQAQTLTTNDDGEQIVVYPDGSWRYFNQPSEQQPPLPNSKDEGHETYTDPDFQAEAEARARSRVRKRTQQQLKLVSSLKKDVIKARKREEKELARVAALRSASATTDRDKLEIATRKLQDYRKTTLALQSQLEEAQDLADILERSLPMTSARRTQYFSSVGVDLEQESGRSSKTRNRDKAGGKTVTLNEISEQAELPKEQRREEKVKRDRNVDKEKYLAYNIEHDVRYNPPAATCIYSYDGVDEFTQRKRIDVAPETFFAFTTPELKPYLGSNSLITATGNLVQSGGYIILELKYTIRSQYANREFGALPKNSPLSIKLIDGGTVTLKNQRLVQGSFDPVEKVYTYAGRYPITGKQAKSLARGLVDQVRVMWGTGFEDYPVYEVDFFKRQLACL